MDCSFSPLVTLPPQEEVAYCSKISNCIMDIVNNCTICNSLQMIPLINNLINEFNDKTKLCTNIFLGEAFQDFCRISLDIIELFPLICKLIAKIICFTDNYSKEIKYDLLESVLRNLSIINPLESQYPIIILANIAAETKEEERFDLFINELATIMNCIKSRPTNFSDLILLKNIICAVNLTYSPIENELIFFLLETVGKLDPVVSYPAVCVLIAYLRARYIHAQGVVIGYGTQNILTTIDTVISSTSNDLISAILELLSIFVYNTPNEDDRRSVILECFDLHTLIPLASHDDSDIRFSCLKFIKCMAYNFAAVLIEYNIISVLRDRIDNEDNYKNRIESIIALSLMFSKYDSTSFQIDIQLDLAEFLLNYLKDEESEIAQYLIVQTLYYIYLNSSTTGKYEEYERIFAENDGDETFEKLESNNNEMVLSALDSYHGIGSLSSISVNMILLKESLEQKRIELENEGIIIKE